MNFDTQTIADVASALEAAKRRLVQQSGELEAKRIDAEIMKRLTEPKRGKR